MPTLIQNGEQTFLDMNGDPLSGGFVYMYTLNTNVFAPTWQDQALTILNTNPVVLDQAGRAVIWGNGYYRQVVTDQFGNVQWDKTAGFDPSQIIGNLNIAGSLTISGLLTASGGIHIPPGQVLNADGLINANAGIVSGGEIHILPGQVLVADGLIYANAGILSGGEIHIVAGQLLVADGLIYANAGIVSGGEIHILPGQLLVADGLINANAGIVSGGEIHIVAGQLLVADGEIIANNGLVVNSGGANIHDGLTVESGMELASGNLNVSGAIVPDIDNSRNLGDAALGWANVYSHIYTTLSTNATSAEVPKGFLNKVKNIPVKTEPHLGIAREDLESIPEATPGEVGVNYSVLVGALWQALKELNDKFDAYVAAHP